MSKRFYIAIILSCVTLCAGLLLFYQSQFTTASDQPNTRLVLQPLTPHTKQKQELQQIVSAQERVPLISSTSSLTLLAVGDIMLDRSVFLKTQASTDWNHPFLLADPLLQEYNLHLANLEGPITTNKSVSNGNGGARFMFTFSPNFVDPLKQRFQFLSLANNHESNFGKNGINQTRKFLGDAGVQYFGDPDNEPGFISVTSSYNGITFALIGYHQLVEHGFDNVLSEVKKLDSQVDVVIAMPHWGVEYATDKPSAMQVQDAHDLIDAGVDIIVGAHPHVVEPLEIYKGKVIFYSLGNFIFDQYFSPETMTGLAVGLTLEKGTGLKVTYSLIPLDINGESQPSVAATAKKEKLLGALSKNSKVDDEIKTQLQDGKFSLDIK